MPSWSAATRLPPAARGAAWMLVTAASFLLMAVAGRELSATVSAFETVALRSMVGIAILLPIVAHAGFGVLRTARPVFHVARHTVHFGGQTAWFYGLGLLPLAEVTALEFTMPIWAIILAALFLGERVDGRRWAAVIAGFIGILIILRPGIAAVSPVALIVLAGAACYGGAATMVKSLMRADNALAVVFYMNVVQLVLGLVPASFAWVTPGWADLPWVLLVGATGLSAHYAFARALALADVSVVFPIDFLRLPTIALIGYLVYSEVVDFWVGLGAAIVFGANYYNVWRQARREHRSARAAA